MIKIANDDGSRELVKKFTRPTKLCKLEFGDFAFTGRGPDSSMLLIGVERKEIKDMVGSIISSRLLGHQLPGMVDSFNRVYLVVEGLYRRSADGDVLMRCGSTWAKYRIAGKPVRYNMVENTIWSVEEFFGCRVVKTTSQIDTVWAVQGIYDYWNNKDYEKHAVAAADYDRERPVTLRKMDMVGKVATRISGIGPDKGLALEGVFESVVNLVDASPEEIARAKGIGLNTANKIYKAFRTGRRKRK